MSRDQRQKLTMTDSDVRGRNMRVIESRFALAAAVFVLALGGTGQASERGGRAVAKASVEGKAEYCLICHGASGQGFRGYYTMPRLAGQQPLYIENQLHAFREHRRLHPIMQNVASSLSPGMIRPLADYLRSLNAPAYGGGPESGVALGKTIFQLGLPEANVPACAVCHGVDAKGVRQIPRLAGQLYWYVTKTLTNFNRERGRGSVADSSAIMAPVARHLTPEQISAVAAYVSSLR
jgi:cytochrome c553